MSRHIAVHYDGDPTQIASIPGRGVIWAAGDTVPADGSQGYATGCIFQHLDGGIDTALYVNEGTFVASDFNAK